VFGFTTFGKVYGLIICLAGLFNFAQSALDYATHGPFHNDPIPVNVILLLTALLVGGSLVIFVYRKSHRMQRGLLEERAEGARESEMPTGVVDVPSGGRGSDMEGVRSRDFGSPQPGGQGLLGGEDGGSKGYGTMEEERSPKSGPVS
jgi:hypothetical protein